MKYFRNVVMICVVSVLGFIVFSPAYAQQEQNAGAKQEQSWRGRDGRMKDRMKEIYDKLNLTEEQKKKIEDNRLKHQESSKATFGEMTSLRENLNQELMKTQLDMNRIKEIQSQIKAVQSRLVDERLEAVLEIRGILTPEQFTQFLSLTRPERRGPAEKGKR